jgi:colanic acid biosynthesis glycosyl transferase WcaI
MNLLIIGLNFAPELTGIGKYTGEMAAWLARQGHDVTVVTAPPYYPRWVVDPQYRHRAWRRETWHGCAIIRCPIYVPRHVTGLRRILHLSSFALSCLPAAFRRSVSRKPDLVTAIAPTLLSAPIALAAGRLASAKTWLHVQDLEIEAAFDLGILKGRRTADAVLGAERKLLKRFDLVSSITPKMLAAIERKGVGPDRRMLLPNWVDLDRIFPLAAPPRLRRELGLPEDRCIALYSGSMGLKHGLETVVAAARKLADSPGSPIFVLAGDGPARRPLQEAAVGLSTVRFLPLQAEDQFNEFLNMADIHLLPQRADAADLVMPSKLGAMLASGRPVVATVRDGTQIATTLAAGGIVVPPGDAERLAIEIKGLSEQPERRLAMGRAARHAAAQFEREAVLRQMEERLMRLCDKPQAAADR